MRLFRNLLVSSVTVFAMSVLAADAPIKPGTTSVKSQLDALVQKVQSKLNEGKRTEAEFAADLKEFDALFAAHEKEKSDEVAQVLAMKAQLYIQVFNDLPKAKAIFQKLAAEFPRTNMGQQAVQVIANIERQEKMQQVQQSLVVGAKFPDFQEKDINGKPLSVGQYKGKVVLVDFWATWCGPCRIELPNVIETYQKHHKSGFEIVGISLDKEAQTMRDYTKESKMTWPQFFDGQVWQNKLAQQYGIMSIPATFLLDRQGTIIARDLRGPELEKAVAAALARK